MKARHAVLLTATAVLVALPFGLTNFWIFIAVEVLAFALKRVPGVVEHGLFLGVADLAIVATPDGVQLLQRTPSSE